MKLVTLYESVLREGEMQSCVARFGKELFDPQISNGGNVEPNTDVENNYLKLIDQFTMYDHGRALNPDFVSAMKTLKGCMSAYPEVLQPDGAAYRSDKILLSDLLDQYIDISDDIKKGGEFTIIYKPKSVIQSWTANKDVAGNFSKPTPQLLKVISKFNRVKDNPQELQNFVKNVSSQLNDIAVPIIITLNTSSDDFLFKVEYFKELSQHEYEDELIRLNNKPTKVSAKIVGSLFDSVYDMLTAIIQSR